MKARFALAAVVALTVANCAEPIVPNYNSPTVEESGKDPSALQLLATGLLAQLRSNATTRILHEGIFGREAFNYTPTEGRNTTHFLQGPVLDNAGFAASNWTPTYFNARNIRSFLQVVATVPLVQAQRDAASGFAKTIEALELLYALDTRDTIGIVVEVKENPAEIAPFVSRDSAFRYISARLDEADADLAAAGAATFPFVLTAGFAGFTTPANFRPFNRAIAARVHTYRGSLGGGVASYNAALTALGQSFINTTVLSLGVGPFNTFSTATGDAANGLFFSATSNIVAHPSIHTDAPLRAGGTRDLRLIAKADTASPAKQPSPDISAGIPSSVRFRVYPTQSTGIAIIRNEELILLRAEARWFSLTDKLGAIADIDYIRANSGGLAPSTLTVLSTDAEFVDELLLQRRYSLLFEGHRWIDHRRFGRLAQLPLDRPNHFVAKVQPVPQGECLIRVNETTPAMWGPGCR